mgnify:CR=1 FL=1
MTSLQVIDILDFNRFAMTFRIDFSRRFLMLTTAVAWLFASGLANAQTQPPIKILVGAPAGGTTDTMARTLAQVLGTQLGRIVVVENRPGAGGNLAAEAVAKAPPDGNTLLMSFTSHAINASLYPSLPFDPVKDFTPLTMVSTSPSMLVAHPKLPVKNVAELIALAKAKPGVLTYGSSGIGSTHHLSMEAFKAALSLDITHIPFKGTGQSVPALIGGQVDMLFSALPSLSGFVKAGQVRLIGNNAGRRSSQEPNVPTLAEVIPGFDFAPIIGVLASTGTPQAAMDRITAEMTWVAKQPETIHILSNAGIEAVGGSASDYARAIADENERLGKAVQTAGIKQQE